MLLNLGLNLQAYIPPGGGLVIPAQMSILAIGQSLMQYRSIRGTPRPMTKMLTDLRVNMGYSTAGTITSYNSGRQFHDGSSQNAGDWTVRIDNGASVGSVLIDVNLASQISTANDLGTTGNYWWNTQDNSAVTGNAADAANSPGPLLRAALATVAARVAAGYPPTLIHWSQGESDLNAIANTATGIDTVKRAQYKSVFISEVVGRIRAAAGLPNMPVFIDIVGRRATGDDLAWENFRQMQRELVAENHHFYDGGEQYAYRMGATGTAAATLTNGSNVVAMINTSGFSANTMVEGPGIPAGSYVSAVTTNVSITLSRLINSGISPSNATASGAITITRLDPIHPYPGSSQTLDGPGGTTHDTTDGFYAIAAHAARRIAHEYRAPGVSYSRGPKVSAVSAGAGNSYVDVTIQHSGGDDFTIADAFPWYVSRNGSRVTVSSVTKQSATSIRLNLADANNQGDEIKVQGVYGCMARSDKSMFIFDNASPLPLPLQSIAPVTTVVA